MRPTSLPTSAPVCLPGRGVRSGRAGVGLAEEGFVASDTRGVYTTRCTLNEALLRAICVVG